MPRTGPDFVACWDEIYEPVFGCWPQSPGCRDCYAQTLAGTLHQRAGFGRLVREFSAGLTKLVRGEPVWNGTLKSLPLGHTALTWPLQYPGAENPALGVGKPTLVFGGSTAEWFLPERPPELVDRAIRILALSRHAGLLVNKTAHLMADYFLKQSDETRQRWQQKFLPAVSVENQEWFDIRWPSMRPLAAEGWTIPLFCAPLIGRLTLPEDYLKLGNRGWVIVGGEQKNRKFVRPRPMDPAWARHLRDQCAEAGVPFWMLHGSHKQRIPDDLFIREVPEWPSC